MISILYTSLHCLICCIYVYHHMSEAYPPAGTARSVKTGSHNFHSHLNTSSTVINWTPAAQATSNLGIHHRSTLTEMKFSSAFYLPLNISNYSWLRYVFISLYTIPLGTYTTCTDYWYLTSSRSLLFTPSGQILSTWLAYLLVEGWLVRTPLTIFF